MLPSCSVQAGVVPGRMLNKGHEEVFAAQAKESERTKQRERKPVSPRCKSAGVVAPDSGGKDPTLLLQLILLLLQLDCSFEARILTLCYAL